MHRRVYTPLMCLSSLTRAVDRTVAACSLQTYAGTPTGQGAQSAVTKVPTFRNLGVLIMVTNQDGIPVNSYPFQHLPGSM